MTILQETFTFSEANLNKAREIIAHYPEGRQNSALLPLLDLAQRQNNGWLSVPVIEYVASLLNIPYMRAYEVATFYTMFNLKPVGKYHLQVCGTTPCWLKGAADIMNVLEKQANTKCGFTSDDEMFTVSEVECLGACINAPVVQVNDDYFEDLTPELAEELINKLKNEKNNIRKL